MDCPKCKRRSYFFPSPGDTPAKPFAAQCGWRSCGHWWMTTCEEAGVMKIPAPTNQEDLR